MTVRQTAIRRAVLMLGVAMALAGSAWFTAAPHASEAAPWSMSMVRSCNAAGGLVVTLYWQSGTNPTAQYVDLSSSNNGWIDGTYTTYGPFGPTVNSIALQSLNQNTSYYVRITAQLPGGGWDVSPTFLIASGSCQAASPQTALCSDFYCAAYFGCGPNFVCSNFGCVNSYCPAFGFGCAPGVACPHFGGFGCAPGVACPHFGGFGCVPGAACAGFAGFGCAPGVACPHFGGFGCQAGFCGQNFNCVTTMVCGGFGCLGGFCPGAGGFPCVGGLCPGPGCVPNLGCTAGCFMGYCGPSLVHAGFVPVAGGHCHPGYAGVCLTVGIGDYDCIGSGGDGPFFVAGPFPVVGADDFALDKNLNGLACDPGDL